MPSILIDYFLFLVLLALFLLACHLIDRAVKKVKAAYLNYKARNQTGSHHLFIQKDRKFY